MSGVTVAPLRVQSLKPLSEALWRGVCETPWRYDLFQLLRRIDALGGELYPLGRAPLPKFEPLRIGQQPSMSFAPSTVAQVKQREENELYEVLILNFGLFGPNGPLPTHMTEYVHERIHHHKDNSFGAFADLFHHRLTLLFYRAWADAQPTVSLDRADNKRFECYLASLIGMGQPGQMKKGGLGEHARFTHAGHLTRHGRDPEGLEKILRNYFRIPVKLIANVPQWMPLTLRERARLGEGRRLPRMGDSAFLGVAVRDVQHKFRIQIGPLNAEEYNLFLPGKAWGTELRDWVLQYVGLEFEWETCVILHADAIQGTTIGSGGQLGYNTWLGIPPRLIPRSDLVYSAEL